MSCVLLRRLSLPVLFPFLSTFIAASFPPGFPCGGFLGVIGSEWNGYGVHGYGYGHCQYIEYGCGSLSSGFSLENLTIKSNTREFMMFHQYTLYNVSSILHNLAKLWLSIRCHSVSI
jgi:hypothetical protein